MCASMCVRLCVCMCVSMCDSSTVCEFAASYNSPVKCLAYSAADSSVYVLLSCGRMVVCNAMVTPTRSPVRTECHGNGRPIHCIVVRPLDTGSVLHHIYWAPDTVCIYCSVCSSILSIPLSLSILTESLSILTAIFQVYPGQPVFIEAKDDGGGGDNWTTGAISRAKLQSNHHHQQTNIQFFYRPDALPVAQPTVSKH